MDIVTELRATSERAARREAAMMAVLPYVFLAISTGITVLEPIPVHVSGALWLALAAVIWVAAFARHPTWRRNRPVMAVYYVGLTAMAAGLVAIAPWYGLFALTGYVHAFEYLGRRARYVGAATTSMIMAVSYMGGLSRIDSDEWWLWGAISLVSTVLAGMSFALIDAADQRSNSQERGLAALHEANVRLEEALEENAGLHSQLLVQAREAGVLDERQRMAREIHDTLAQSLAGILTQLHAAEQRLEESSPLGRHVTAALELAREGLAEARRTVHAIQPEVLVEARLPDAIRDVTRRWSETHQVDAALTTTGHPRPMHTDVEVTLLRTAQEALTNVAKHADASRVGLTLSYMEDIVTLDVRDDGVGFDPTAERLTAKGSVDGAEGGFGLVAMRQRVQRLAGRIAIESEPGGGTAVSASVPAIPAGGER